MVVPASAMKSMKGTWTDVSDTTDSPNLDLTALRATAEAAEKEPWPKDYVYEAVRHIRRTLEGIAIPYSEFIAATDPSTVIALLDLVKELEGALAGMLAAFAPGAHTCWLSAALYPCPKCAYDIASMVIREASDG